MKPIPAFLVVTTLVAVAGLAPSAIAQSTYGNGTPGTGGIAPEIGSPQAWLGNPDFGIDVTDGLGGAACIVLASAFPANTNAYGMTLLAEPTAALGTYFFVLGGSPGVAGAGNGFLPLSLATAPTTATFAGIDFYFQGFVLDPSGPGVGGGLAASNGLRATLTMPRELAAFANSAHYRLDAAGVGFAQAVPFDNVHGIAFDNEGRDLYATAGGALWHGDLRGAPVWTEINSSLGSTTAAWGNLEIQYPLQWGWTGSRAGGTAVELRLVDLLPGSGTYGQIVGQTNGLDAAIGPLGSWGLSPDGRFVAAASAWNGSLAIVDADPASAAYLQILTSTPIPASTSAPGFTVNNDVIWAPDSERVYIARQNQNTNPGEIACYDRTTGWVDFDPSTPWFVDHIGANSVPAVTLPPGVRRITIAPTGDALYAAGSALGGGFVGRIELPSLAFSYGNGTTWMRHVTHLALTPDGDMLAACVPGTIVLYDTATMAETGSQALGSGVEIDDLRWR